MIDKSRVEKAIAEAELHTSGEIRVFMEENCNGDVLDRAAEVFEKIGIHKTASRNGVLFYFATDDHKFAILGDAGINAITGIGYWDEIKNAMLPFLKEGKLTEALETGIAMAGKALSIHFPYDSKSDKNELSNEVIIG